MLSVPDNKEEADFINDNHKDAEFNAGHEDDSDDDQEEIASQYRTLDDSIINTEEGEDRIDLDQGYVHVLLQYLITIHLHIKSSLFWLAID